MKKLISARLAGNVLLFAIVVITFFHLAVLSGLVPTDIVWGGRADQFGLSIVALEFVSLSVIAVFAVIVLAKRKSIAKGKSIWIVDVGLWFMFGLFVLNTFGNLAALTSTETLMFTPITALLALCAWRMAVEK